MKKTMWAFLLLATNSFTGHSYADIRPERVFNAVSKKTKTYVKDGLITGGDRSIDGVTVKDIRKSSNADFDRIVIDLSGTRIRDIASPERAPYFQIAVSPDERRLIFTLWGSPKLSFNAKKVISAFKRSSVIENLLLLPRLEDKLWTFVIELKSDTPVEAFELSNPVRVILDIQHKKS